MKIVLLEDIDNLGYEGDIKEVKDGYARNYLIPKGKVLQATKNNIKLVEEKRRNILGKIEKRVKSAEKAKKALDGITVEISARAGEKGKLFGSITTSEIFEQIKGRAKDVDKKNIKLLEGGIKTTGEHDVEISIYRDVKASFKVVVKPSDEQ